MLRAHCIQLFYNLSAPCMEDLLRESDPVRRFVGMKLAGPLPDETTILNFRHLLEGHNRGPGLLKEINSRLESQGLKLREGTIVDATIIEAPSSTKNHAGERDLEMHQTRKGNQWHFGMKAHIGVDSETGIVHSLSTTAANAHGVTEAHNLLHGGETVVWGDAGYQGVHKKEKTQGSDVEWQVGMRLGLGRKLDPDSDEAVREKAKASVRAKVEHPFLRVKGLFGYGKVRYRGLMKNTQRLALQSGLGNLLTVEGQLGGSGPCGIPKLPTGLRTAPMAPEEALPLGRNAVRQSPDRCISTNAHLSNSIQATTDPVQRFPTQPAPPLPFGPSINRKEGPKCEHSSYSSLYLQPW